MIVSVVNKGAILQAINLDRIASIYIEEAEGVYSIIATTGSENDIHIVSFSSEFYWNAKEMASKVLSNLLNYWSKKEELFVIDLVKEDQLANKKNSLNVYLSEKVAFRITDEPGVIHVFYLNEKLFQIGVYKLNIFTGEHEPIFFGLNADIKVASTKFRVMIQQYDPNKEIEIDGAAGFTEENFAPIYKVTQNRIIDYINRNVELKNRIES